MTTHPWSAAHGAALAEGRHHYADPATGYLVFTEHAHLARGTCCGSGCRHCPFERTSTRRPSRAHAPWLMGADRGPAAGEAVQVVSWSGGKDAWLAWQARREHPTVWLTTFDPSTGQLPVQGVSLATVQRQADRAGVPLVASPVGPDRPVDRASVEGLDVVARRWPVRAVVFGDLWLPDIPDARRRALGAWLDARGATLELPLWKMPYAGLLRRLFDGGPRVRVSASRIPAARVGDAFDRALVEGLPDGVDAMGEGGEFHTEVLADDLAGASDPGSDAAVR